MIARGVAVALIAVVPTVACGGGSGAARDGASDHPNASDAGPDAVVNDAAGEVPMTDDGGAGSIDADAAGGDTVGVDAAGADTAGDGSEHAPNDAGDTPSGTDAGDAPSGTDASLGCAVLDGPGAWSFVPNTKSSYRGMWSTAPTSFVYYDSDRQELRKWSGAASTALAVQPPAAPFKVSSTIRGSGDDDIWLGGSGPWMRTGVNDRMDVDVAHWDGVSWKDLTFFIPVSPDITNPMPALGAFWAVGPDEAWQWATPNWFGAAALPFVPYHLAGGTWQAVPSPLDTLTGAWPVAMWGAAKNDIWLAGYNGTIPFLLHWDGSTWSQVAVPLPSGQIYISRIQSLWGTAANDVWAVGSTAFSSIQGSADTWHFDGDHWTELPVDAPTFTAVWGTCPSDYWAVAGNDYQAWHYDGRKWSKVLLPNNPRTTGVLTGSRSGDVWLSVQGSYSSCDGRPLESGLGTLLHWGRSRCGDGVVAGGETCDPPQSSGDGLRCDDTCQRPRCGNGVTDPGEDCDPPNHASGLLCDDTCHRPTCGNGVIDTGEQCDPPADGSCDSQCRSIASVCGDHIKQAGEECDFDDPAQTLCTRDCKRACFYPCLFSNPGIPAGLCSNAACSSSVAGAQCSTLLACMIGCTSANIRNSFSSFSCFCQDTACTKDGPCAAAARTLLAIEQPDLDTNNPAVLASQAEYGGRLYRIAETAANVKAAPTTYCSMACAGR